MSSNSATNTMSHTQSVARQELNNPAKTHYSSKIVNALMHAEAASSKDNIIKEKFHSQSRDESIAEAAQGILEHQEEISQNMQDPQTREAMEQGVKAISGGTLQQIYQKMRDLTQALGGDISQVTDFFIGALEQVNVLDSFAQNLEENYLGVRQIRDDLAAANNSELLEQFNSGLSEEQLQGAQKITAEELQAGKSASMERGAKDLQNLQSRQQQSGINL